MAAEQQWEWVVVGEAGTERLGQVLATCLPPRMTVALIGTLGAGKTRLVQALAVAVGIPREAVTSPTFVLCQHYQGTTRIHHLDAYRLRDDDEWLELGVDELTAGDGWTVIEWADRFHQYLSEPLLDIELQVTDDPQRRRVRVSAHGAEAVRVLQCLRQALDRPPAA